MDSVTLPTDIRAATYVVMPAYNEEPYIAQAVGELLPEYPNVVVVDDGSSDGTYEATKLCAPHILRHAINRGQGAALQTAITYALSCGAKYVVTFDADGQHRVEDIAAMVAPIWRGECDITLGSRFLGGTDNIPVSRRRMLRAAVLFTRVVNRVDVTDTHNGFRAFSRRAAQRINITLDRDRKSVV